MDKIEDKIIVHFDKLKDDSFDKFGSLWELEDSFDRHIKGKTDEKFRKYFKNIRN